MDRLPDNGISCVFSRQHWAAAGDRRWLAACNLLLAALALGLFCGYLWLNNRTAAYGFAIRDLEARIDQLQEDKRRIDLDFLSRRAMDNVESQVTGMGFVPVEGIDYLVTGSSGMALR